MKATRNDVATLAGVSSATVSNVMNHSDKVKEKTVFRVRQAMEALHYKPSLIPRGLTTHKTMQIGIALEDIRNPYYGEIVEHFEAVANANGYFVNICIGSQNLEHYFDNFITRGLDGVFVASLPYRFEMSKLYRLLDNGIKLIVGGNADAGFPLMSRIETDYRTGMQQAMNYLVQLGHQDIAYLSGLGRELIYDDRCCAYLEQVRRLNLSCGESLLIDGKFPYYTNVAVGYHHAKRLLQKRQPFTAVICCNDLMAMGAIRALTESGLNVPHDVSVIGFDGIALGRYCSPTLTTLAMPSKSFGEKAFELLHFDMLHNEIGFFCNRLKLIEGESTAERR